ncbi:hypothetical protein ZIOFF_017161 [Zingiber officinale]|uniref:Chromo domain-containing protein n=1 Tax=Zingiber officinale TaxID=94328 RepID=A0A8J5H6S0_ZINOF|nr:hypothetical protein ZIOFF_017161 [Zingiber officinale]
MPKMWVNVLEERVATQEGSMEEIRGIMQRLMYEVQHGSLLREISKQLGIRVEATPLKGASISADEPSQSEPQEHQSDQLEEYRMSIKKVELPMFDDLPNGLEVTLEDEVEPEYVIASRHIVHNGEVIRQWLVKWKGKDMIDTMWEDDFTLRTQFPHFSLEDKARIVAGGNDRNPVPSGYARLSKCSK